MKDPWEESLACAVQCSRCHASLKGEDRRILSVYDHQPICMECKGKEEKEPDYEDVSKNLIGTCMAESEVLYGDPQGYCFYHFYPFACH